MNKCLRFFHCFVHTMKVTKTVWFPTFFKMSSSMLHRRLKVITVWNYIPSIFRWTVDWVGTSKNIHCQSKVFLSFGEHKKLKNLTEHNIFKGSVIQRHEVRMWCVLPAILFCMWETGFREVEQLHLILERWMDRYWYSVITDCSIAVSLLMTFN